MFPELAEELRPGQRSLAAGHLGPEGLHEGGGPGGRDAEEPFDVAAGEEGPVELFELADGVWDGEEPPGLGGHPRSWSIRCIRTSWDDFRAHMYFEHVSRRFYRMQDPGSAWSEGPIKGVMGPPDRDIHVRLADVGGGEVRVELRSWRILS